jgi:nucleoid DNA-binding protein
MEKVTFADFARQVSKRSGYAQKDIKEVLHTCSKCIAENLNKGMETTVMMGMIVYPATYPGFNRVENGETIHYDEVVYPRARFGQAFKKQML